MQTQWNTLGECFSHKDLTPYALFSNKDLYKQIKHNIEDFIGFSKRHRNFILETIRLGLSCSYQQVEERSLSEIVNAVNQILTLDEPEMMELFFEAPPAEETIKNSSQISEKIDEQPSEAENIQSEAERLFENDNDSIEQSKHEIKEAPVEVKIYRFSTLRATLQVLEKGENNSPEMNESCLGYVYKIWSSLIRNDANQVLEFLQADPEAYELLMTNLQYYSVSNIVGQLLVSEDKSKEYRYEGLKRKILQRVIKTLLKKKSDQNLYEGISVLLEEVFNSSKQTYYENFEDFKRVVNLLTSSETISKFYNILSDTSQASFSNAIKYLQLVFQRILSQKQDNYYADNQESQNSELAMKFEIDILFEKYRNLITYIEFIQKYDILVRINYLTLLYDMTQTPQIEKFWPKMDLERILAFLFKIYKSHYSTGIYKTKLSKLISEIVKKCSQTQIQNVVNKIPGFNSEFFSALRQINVNNNRNYNRDELVAFDCQLLFSLEEKLPNSIEAVSEAQNKDIKRIRKNYNVKIANFNNNKEPNLQSASPFFNSSERHDLLSKWSNNQSTSNQASENIVGKNQISIPSLHLNYQGSSNQSSDESKSSRESTGNEKPSLKLDVPIEPRIEVQEIEVIQLEPIQTSQGIELKEKSNQENDCPNNQSQKGELHGESARKFYVKHLELSV